MSPFSFDGCENSHLICLSFNPLFWRTFFVQINYLKNRVISVETSNMHFLNEDLLLSEEDVFRANTYFVHKSLTKRKIRWRDIKKKVFQIIFNWSKTKFQIVLDKNLKREYTMFNLNVIFLSSEYDVITNLFNLLRNIIGI